MFRCPNEEASSLSQSTTTHPQCQCVPHVGFLMTGRIPAQLGRLRGSSGRPHQAAVEERGLFGRSVLQLVQQQEPQYGVLAMLDFAKKCIKSL